MTAAGSFYHSVIDDVIDGLKNSKNPEDYVDESVLQELKQVWIRRLIMAVGGPIEQPSAPPYVQDVRDSTFTMAAKANSSLLSDPHPTKLVPITVNISNPPKSSMNHDVNSDHDGQLIEDDLRSFTLMVKVSRLSDP